MCPKKRGRLSTSAIDWRCCLSLSSVRAVGARGDPSRLRDLRIDRDLVGAVRGLSHREIRPRGDDQHQRRSPIPLVCELGYVPSRNVILTHQFAEPKAVEQAVVRLLPGTDLLVIWTTLGAVIAKKVASGVPWCFSV